ncbi:MAG: SsrA-binding protein SmpB [Patescibacteria group bacterium]
MKLITLNKKAYHNYEILETLEAGIVLSGPEVKAVKQGRIDLSNSYITIDKNQIPWIINLNIAPYPPAKGVQENYNPSQPRKLLLKKKEISSLIGKTKIKGLTVIPLKVYNKHGFIKIEIGIVKGKKKIDKREEIKKREIEKRIKEELKGG